MTGSVSWIIVPLLVASGCISGAQSFGPAPWSREYHERTGRVTETDLFMRLPRVLARHGYLIDTGERYDGRVRLDTHWKRRDVFRDERAAGFEAARTRLRFRARWEGRMYVLHISVENRFLTRDDEWVRGAATEMFDSYAQDIASDVRMELASGIRRY